MIKTEWKIGDYNAICDGCGFKFKASQLKQRWDGMMMCEDDWEVRHPLDFVRPTPAPSKLPWTRPESADTFILSCSRNGRQGLAGYGEAGCAIVGLNLGYF